MQLNSDFDLGDINRWSSFVLIRVLSNHADGLSDEQRAKSKLDTPLGYVFVIDPKFGASAQYKLPNGHSKPGETPFDTAVREARGETGISIPPDRMQYKHKELGSRGDHWRILFSGYIFEHELRQMNDRDPENEGEQPKYFTVAEFRQCLFRGKFMRGHLNMLRDCNLVPQFGLDRVA